MYISLLNLGFVAYIYIDVYKFAQSWFLWRIFTYMYISLLDPGLWRIFT